MEKMDAPVALITGGSRGLGFEVAKALSSQGFELILIAKDADRLHSAANELGLHRAVLRGIGEHGRIAEHRATYADCIATSGA